jgi:predicted RNase H-like HicB family nuclease
MTKVSIVLEDKQEEGFLATVLGLPDCKAQGNSRQEALDNVQKVLFDHLQGSEIVEIDIEHSLLKRAGIFQDDPQFNDMLEFIEADRRKLDAELEAEYT